MFDENSRIRAKLLSRSPTFTLILKNAQEQHLSFNYFSFLLLRWASVLHGQQFPLSTTHMNVFPLYSLPIFLQMKHLTRNLKALFSSHPHFKSTSPHAAHKKLSADNASVARRMGALGHYQANGTFVLHKGSCCYHGLEFCMGKRRKTKHPKDPGESCFR